MRCCSRNAECVRIYCHVTSHTFEKVFRQFLQLLLCKFEQDANRSVLPVVLLDDDDGFWNPEFFDMSKVLLTAETQRIVADCLKSLELVHRSKLIVTDET